MSAEESFFSLPVIVSIVSLITVISGLAANHYRSVIGQNERIHSIRVETTEKIRAIEITAVELKARFDVFWNVVEKELPKILIRPTHKEMDELLIKTAKDNITPDEASKLKKMIKDELDSGLGKEDSGKAVGFVLVLAHLESKMATETGESAD